MKNIEEPITFAWAGIPRAAAVYTNFGKVVTVPELKLVIIKSSKAVSYTHLTLPTKRIV